MSSDQANLLPIRGTECMLYSAPGVYRECTFRSEQIASQPMLLLLISFNIGLTEVVPTVGVERGEGAYV